jgi:hypothetical protein
MHQFIKKVEIVEAMQVHHDTPSSVLRTFCGGSYGVDGNGEYVATIKGRSPFALGDWIVKSDNTEFVILSNQRFRDAYVPAAGSHY